MTRHKQPAALSDQLKAAVAASGLTRYAVAKGAGIEYRSLCRFLDNERDIYMNTADKLAAFLNLELTQRKGR